MGALERDGETERAGDLVRLGDAPRSPGRGDLCGITEVDKSASPTTINENIRALGVSLLM